MKGHIGREKATLIGCFGTFHYVSTVMLDGNSIVDFEIIRKLERLHGKVEDLSVITRDGEKYDVCQKCKMVLIVSGVCEDCTEDDKKTI